MSYHKWNIQSNFLLSVEILDCIGFALLRSVIGPENSCPLSQPIKCKTETHHELVVRGFPALHAVWLFLLWVHHWFSKVFFFSSDWSLITLVLVFAALNRYAPYWYWSLVGNSSSLTIGTLRLSLSVSCIDQWWLTGSVHRFRTMQFSLPQEHSVWRFVYSLG